MDDVDESNQSIFHEYEIGMWLQNIWRCDKLQLKYTLKDREALFEPARGAANACLQRIRMVNGLYLFCETTYGPYSRDHKLFHAYIV